MAFGGVPGGIPGVALGVVPGGAPSGTGGLSGGLAGGAVDPDKKEAYYIRLHLLIIKVGKGILKARFDHSVPPHQLHAKLQQCMKTIKYAKKINLLSKSQLSQLFPQYKPPSSDTFDVSLLVYLLENICGLKTNFKWWSELDNSKIPDNVVNEEADIARLRNLIIQMQHIWVPSHEQGEFETMWDLAEKVMLRLATTCNIPDQKQKIDDIKNKQLDIVTEEMRSRRDYGQAGYAFRTQHDDTLSAPYIIQYANLMPSVGRLHYSTGSGTAFRVGSKYAMTAWHVVEAITDPHKIRHYDFNRIHDNDSVFIQFGGANLKRYKLKGLNIFHNKDLDVSVLEFDDSGLSALPPPLSLFHHIVFDKKDLSDIAIIGYGHSTYDTKCITHSAKLLDKDCIQSQINTVMKGLALNREELRLYLKIVGKDPDMVDRGYSGYDSQDRILFNTFVGPGASGSPLFTKADPSSLEVVGVYTCGYPELAYNLPNKLEYWKDLTFEAGTKMSSIYEAVSLADQTLLKDLFKN